MDSLYNEIHQHQAHVHQIRDLDFSSSWAKFVTCGDDGIVKIFDFNEWEVELEIIAQGNDIMTSQWHPFESLIATAGRQCEIRLWDPRSGRKLYSVQPHTDSITKLRFNQNGNWLLSGSKDTSIKIFDIRVMKNFSTLKSHHASISALEWHPEWEELFASGGVDK